jgi:hypothetical protein
LRTTRGHNKTQKKGNYQTSHDMCFKFHVIYRICHGQWMDIF